MLYAILVGFSALAFFVMVPGIGAYVVRQRWRQFRRRVMDSLAWPVYHPGLVALGGGPNRDFRFYGILEAVEDNDRLWVRDNQSSVAIDIRNTTVFMTPVDTDLDWGSLYANSMRGMRWENSGVLPEGLGVLVAGEVKLEAGLPTFAGSGRSAPLVIFFDGDAKAAVTRAIWFGRQRNEYWNDVTLISLLTGFVALLALAFFGFRDDGTRTLAVYSASLALIPFLPLMPPGIIGFFLYRRFWRQGRTLRARRDLSILRQRVQNLRPEGIAVADLPPGKDSGLNGTGTVFRIRVLELGGLAVLGIGILGNLYIVLRLIIQLLNNS